MRIIIVPTYNEVGNIETLVQGIFSAIKDVHILFVDDNSRDGTTKVIDEQASIYSGKIFLIQRPGKLGLGTAYIKGFHWALHKGYEKIVQMDADLSHNPQYLPKLFDKLDIHDAVYGSRYVNGGGVENWGLLRRLISQFGSLYARMILMTRILDFTGGYNAWRASTLRAIELESIKSRGYAFQIELKYRCHRAGLRYEEVPITFIDRAVGQSKMSTFIIIEAMLRVLLLRGLHPKKT